MAGLDDITDLQTFEQVLQDRARELIEFLDKGDFTSAMQILAELSEARSAMLYREVGRLTRGLHEALKEFNIDVEKSAAMQATSGGEASEVASANERLNYVLELTEKAANTTMDMVDASMPIAEELGEQARLLRDDWKRMADKESTLSELKDLGRSTESFLLQIESGSGALHKNFTDILLAQGFQDITGQLIKRVIGLVNEVESSLVKLVSVAGKVDRITGIKREAELEARSQAKEGSTDLKGHGPQVLKHETTSEVVAGQDDVDDLLSSLGF
ncbi:protein phosphatase CheZ [Motiliproteus sp. SC1-56]|uniref:protein phosphatase CheZ n=1 Tax=Motiliproteus sp. SC1-56 TaxID=2799565 RepID=UPI001A8FA6AF|nr:protein phosphatase CheZ [Motiliproteus sp. SC1-56]